MRLIVLAVALLVAAPGVARAQSVQVENAWARATAAGAMSGGIFLTVTDGGAPDRLVGASTPVAAMAELHETVNDNGVMRMRPVAGLKLEAGKPVVLQPGGYHVMLMGLKQQLKPGDSFPVTLNFEKGAPVTATVMVETAGASAPPMGNMPGMKMP